jgi:hypothetical protein
MKNTKDAETDLVLGQADAGRHFLVRFRTESIDAGMPMPAVVSSMLMPSYAMQP